MGSKHNDAFRGHLDTLVADVDPDALRQSLFLKNVISVPMMELFKEGVYSRTERSRRLFKYLEKRGVFSQLVDSLVETGQTHLAVLLNPDVAAKVKLVEEDGVGGATAEHQPETSHCPPDVLNEDTQFVERNRGPNATRPLSRINIGETPPTYTVRMATKRLDRSYCPDLQVYPMGSNPKGLLLLINNVRFAGDAYNYRQGAEVDQRSLTLLFEKLGFQVILLTDLPLASLMRRIVEFASDSRLRGVCALVVAVMSHGIEVDNRTMIITHDGGPLDTEWVVSQFNGASCPSMIQRPKVFLFQTCRGVRKEQGVEARRIAHQRTHTDGSTDLKFMRASGDILIAHSTLPGYISNRDLHLGTWYIQGICEVFSEHACDTDLEDMLKMVDSRLSRLISEVGTMQASSYENRGFRKFYFVPGLYDAPAVKPAVVSRGTQSPCRPPAEVVEAEVTVANAALSESEDARELFALEAAESVSPQPMSQGSQPTVSEEPREDAELVGLRMAAGDLPWKERRLEVSTFDLSTLDAGRSLLEGLALAGESKGVESMEFELQHA